MSTASKKRPRPRPRKLRLSASHKDTALDGSKAGPSKLRRTYPASPSFLTPTLSKLSESASSLGVSELHESRSFFDLDSLESGAAREVVHPNVLSYVTLRCVDA